MSGEMRVDQAKAARVVASLRERAADIERFIPDSDALHETLVEQASRGTRKRRPAPGYKPLVDVHGALMRRHKQVYADAAAQLRHAADVLEAAAAAAASTDANAAAAIGRIWDEAGWGNGGTGSLPSAGAGWWQAQRGGVRFRAESDRAGAGTEAPLRFRGGGEPVEPAVRLQPLRQAVGEERPATVDFRPLRQVAGEEEGAPRG